MRVAVPWTTEELMVDLEEDVVSHHVLTHDVRSGQVLRFRVHLARGGFFRCLEGEADGRWPRRWEIDAEELSTAAAGALVLPGDASPDALASWLDIARPEGRGLIVRQPATTGSVGALEHREGSLLPAEVRELLAITDGFVVGDWAILGVRDLHVVDVEGRSCWQVAAGISAEDDRRCLLDPHDGLIVVPSHEARPDDFELVGMDLRDWIARLMVG